LPLDNKRQIFILAGALLAGIIAVFLTSNYVKNTVQSQTQVLAEQYNVKQRQMVAGLEQRSDQQMAAMAQELQAVKQEQAQAMQKQLALMQQAQQNHGSAGQGVHVRKPPLKTPEGKRAVTVSIDSLSAVGGLLSPGDYVDVIAQLNVPSQTADKKTVTAMIFQDLQILAINTNVDETGTYDDQQGGALRITLAVDPQQAGLLAFCNKNGTLELALRSPNESETPALKADTWKTLTDYVMQSQGYDIKDPDGVNGGKEEAKPNIQIFRGGKEL
jgi:Flp pilus assembly protein CpaB